MDIGTVGTPKTHEAIEQQPIDIYRDTLLTTLQAAAHSATRRQRRILASFTFPITAYDPVRTFQGARQAELGACFFWEHPVEHQVLVGVGAALTIETRGSSCFTDAASMWREVMQDAIVRNTVPSQDGPIFFGGFSFDPFSPPTPHWADFPDGLLILPSLLVSSREGYTTLTINRMIAVEDDSDQRADEMIAEAKRLYSAIVEVQHIAPSESLGTSADAKYRAYDMLPASEWMTLVAETVQHIQQGTYEKVVLARGIQVTLSAPTATFGIAATLQQLRQQYPDTYIFAIQRGDRFFAGATPERLIQARDRQIRTMALAGSAPRGASEEEDTQLGVDLLQNRKNNVEHALVVAEVRDALLAHCTQVHVLEKPQLLKLKNVQHLKTPIVGELLPGRCILDVMAQLHPTPAVGGFPREAALTAIRNTEQLDRGWYAGPLGWIGASGHGEFAVALRSGLVDGNTATLFAGCGIVAGSDPQSEYDESCLKLEVMLRGLQVHNHDDM